MQQEETILTDVSAKKKWSVTGDGPTSGFDMKEDSDIEERTMVENSVLEVLITIEVMIDR